MIRVAQRQERIEQLAKPTLHQEVVFTPGPTYYSPKPEPFVEKKIPMCFKSGRKRNYTQVLKVKPSSPEGCITSNSRAYQLTQPKSFSATFSLEPRFGWSSEREKEGTAGPITTEAAWKASLPKSYAANFNLATAGNAFPKDPLLLKGTTGPAPGYYSSDSNTIVDAVKRNAGGVISKESRNMNWAVHQESPGPIYNPKYTHVESNSVGGAFSKCEMKVHKSAGPGPLTYADGSLKALSSLSTSRRSPSPVFSTRPSASQMPLPFDKYNFHNSGTMRTRLRGPAGEKARKQAEAGSKKRNDFWSSRMRKTIPTYPMRRPSTAPGTVIHVMDRKSARLDNPDRIRVRPATAPPDMTSRKVRMIQKNPLKELMAIAEKGYAIGGIKLSTGPPPEYASALDALSSTNMQSALELKGEKTEDDNKEFTNAYDSNVEEEEKEEEEKKEEEKEKVKEEEKQEEKTVATNNLREDEGPGQNMLGGLEAQLEDAYNSIVENINTAAAAQGLIAQSIEEEERACSRVLPE